LNHLHPIRVLVRFQLFGQLVDLGLHLTFAISQPLLHSFKFAERCLYHQQFFKSSTGANTYVWAGDQLTGREELVQEANGVEPSGNTVERAYIIAVPNVEDALEREDNLERKLLTGHVWL
jgi:hypothetical protein